MSEAGFQEKTEKATPKRRAHARKKGQVAQSREVPSVLILLTALGVFFFSGAWMFWSLAGFMGGVFQNIATFRIQDVGTASVLLREIFTTAVTVIFPLMLFVFVAGIGGNIVQFGFLIHGEKLTPQLKRLNPIKGIKRLISLRSLVELAKSVLKLTIVGGIAYLLVKGELTTIPSLVQLHVGEIAAFMGRVSLKICFYVCLVLIALSVFDYAYQRWEHEKSLKMTKQEIKDEHKQTQGDPKIKARIRKIQLEVAQRRMMEAIPEADVVITNPTQLAVALKFDANEMIAPCVTAKGAGYIAARIKQKAGEHKVPIVENKPLAQTLYKATQIGDLIPVELYQAVAEILAYVYRLKGKQHFV
jgi:flagellar biosynthetic protein FlhB